jgi:hypothetical protein
LRAAARVRLIVLLIGGPILALTALDRAVVSSDAHWAWVAREVPPLTLDPYRLEGVLRSATPGRQNVPILGNSIAEMALDGEALERRFIEAGLRFPKLTIGGSPTVTFGMLADAVGSLEPRAAVYVASAPSLRSRDYLDHVYIYDLTAVPALFTAGEVWEEPGFHLGGIAGQVYVFARHRRALQRALLVRLGRLRWQRLQLDAERIRLRHMADGADTWQAWVRDDELDAYPNPNTRALGLLARRLRERDARLIVVDAPVHPIPLMLGMRRRLERYRAHLRELADSEGFALVSAEALPELDEDDFSDWVHANERGRERLTTYLAGYLADRL